MIFKIMRAGGDVWTAVEVMNEPDLTQGVPPDQLGPLLKAVRFALPNTTLVGGVFTAAVFRFGSGYVDTFARNGLLDVVDVLSFHSCALRTAGSSRAASVQVLTVDA